MPKAFNRWDQWLSIEDINVDQKPCLNFTASTSFVKLGALNKQKKLGHILIEINEILSYKLNEYIKIFLLYIIFHLIRRTALFLTVTIEYWFTMKQNFSSKKMSAFVRFIAALNFLFNWTLIYLLFTMSTTLTSWIWNENRCFIFEIELTDTEGRISQVKFTGCFIKCVFHSNMI